MVSILTHEDGRTELGSIYVYKNAIALAELNEFLGDLHVDNMENMQAARNYLRTVNE
jgi:hypothetical protein